MSSIVDRADKSTSMRLLLHYGASVDQRGVNDWTPLHYAVARRNLEVVKLLLEHAPMRRRGRGSTTIDTPGGRPPAGFTEAAR